MVELIDYIKSLFKEEKKSCRYCEPVFIQPLPLTISLSSEQNADLLQKPEF